MTAINCYKILGINEGATQDEIKKAYKRLALKWHPDKNKSPDATQKMQEISEAYEKLRDRKFAEQKRNYDYNPNYYNYEFPTDKSLVLSDKVLIKETLKRLSNSADILKWAYAYSNSPKKVVEVVNDYDIENTKTLLKVLNLISEMNKEGREFENRGDGQGWKSARIKYINDLELGSGVSWFHQNIDWEWVVKSFKTHINYFQKELEFIESTDQDLTLFKGNDNQNSEKPQIPGPGKPQQIKAGKFDEYNKLYSGGTHEVHVKFDELYSKIIDQMYSKDRKEWNQAGYDNLAKFPSFAEAYEKLNEASRGGKWFIPNDADASQEAEGKKYNEECINKKREAIKSIEKLLAEQSGNGNNSVGKIKDNNIDESASRKRKAEIELLNENDKKSKTVADDLERLIQEAQEINTYAELEAKMKEIDEYQEEEAYQGQYQEAIKQLKVNLAKLDEGKYRTKVIQKIQDKFNESGVNENDLDEETKSKLAKIRKGEINEINEINEIEGKINTQVGEKKAEKSLNDWLEKARKLVEGKIKGSLSYLEEQLREIQKNLSSFQHGTNFYQNQVYRNKENDVKAMMSKLDNYSTKSHAIQPNKSGFLQAKYVVPTVLVTVGLIVVIGIVIGKRKQVKVKK